MSGEREWPVAGFQYRCSTGHWVTSRKVDLVDTNCPAIFRFSGDATVPVPCHGTLGYPMVDGEEAADEIERLRAAGDALAEALRDGLRHNHTLRGNAAQALESYKEARRER